jgi:predicted lysophospholipase L1 biosynthesis ABC-type transport system permease subunit
MASTDVVIVNDVLAERLWPGQRAVGRRLRIGSRAGAVAEVVGVARAARYRQLGESPRAALWRSLDRSPRSRTTVVVRTRGDEHALLAPLRAAVRETDATLPVIGLTTLGEHVSVAYSAIESSAIGALAFATLSALLAASGIFGVVAYGVSRRRREIGIRLALGATNGRVLRLVVGRAFRATAAGVTLGVVVVLALPAALDRLLYGVSHRDPFTVAAAVLLFAAVATVAALVPALRATRVAPMAELRVT